MDQTQIADYSKLISKGEIKSAIEYLLIHTKEDLGLNLEVISMSARFNHNESRYLSRLISYEEYKLELSQIIQLATSFIYSKKLVEVYDEEPEIAITDNTVSLISIMFFVRSKGATYKLRVNKNIPISYLVTELLKKFDTKRKLLEIAKEGKFINAILCKELDSEIILLESGSAP